MTLFSDNPGLERMMQQKPAGRQVSEERPAPAPDSPCYDCGYGKGRRCVGICYKKLMGEKDPLVKVPVLSKTTTSA